MEFEKLVHSGIRLSSFITVRLLFFVSVALIFVPFTGYSEEEATDLVFSLPFVDSLITEYSRIVSALGIEAVAIYLLLFVLISVLHFTYETAVIIGAVLPVALRVDKLHRVERRYTKALVERLLRAEIPAELISRFTAACQDCKDGIDPSLEEKARSSTEHYNVLKTFVLIYVIFVVLFPADTMMAEFEDYTIGVLLVLIAITAVTLYQSYVHLRDQYREMIEELEDCVEKHLRPVVDDALYSELMALSFDLKRGFHWQWDWQLPVIGSLRRAVNESEDQF